ncbi:hypothetical protein [Leptolyngbya sp. 7M]|uniref:hypothetical protein n=1 Tax=Leptolyngbya sp. 7M TaxID=2812896 RepID=UPI001B8C3053|nr:hypothetical protein [Leptolyngbya sp. 7M]QYO61928.1 hypothetical protein JVX88_17500 [Leptolyngbya sp. 7M]
MSKKLPRKERRFRAIRQLEDVEIRVQEPCAVSWGTMVGNRSVRKCPICQLNVYDFAGMAPDEILALINQHEGKLCAQFYARADGTMTVKPCNETREEHRVIRGRVSVFDTAE